MKSLCIVVPVYNDWTSFGVLLEKLNAVAKTLPVSLLVLGIDDGSTEPQPEWAEEGGGKGKWEALAGVQIVQLAANVGHQRAIAIGLCVAVEDHDRDAVLVMDGDGEDPPEAIATLLEPAATAKDFCIVAQRRKRTENATFQVSYLVYKAVFRTVTGKKISFGNFSLTSRSYVRRLVMIPDLWNNLAAAILRSRLPVTRVPVDRGHRYAGKSKMNFVSLIVHGMSGISVYDCSVDSDLAGSAHLFSAARHTGLGNHGQLWTHHHLPSGLFDHALVDSDDPQQSCAAPGDAVYGL